MTPSCVLHRRAVTAVRPFLLVTVAALTLAGAEVLTLVGPDAAAAATAGPVPVITPAPTGGAFANGQTISISVGPNSTFDPYSRIVILECADPGGTVANLPVSDATCDGNTVQYGSILVAPNGSFAERAYRLYQLPNRELSETPGGQPVCNSSEECVLYIGQDQNDFTQPKVFSAPFAVDPSAGPVPAGQPTPVGSAHAGTAAGTGSAAHTSGATSAAEAGRSSAPAPARASTASTEDPPSRTAAPAPASGSQGTVGSGTDPVLWLLLGGIVLILLALGGVELRRRRLT